MIRSSTTSPPASTPGRQASRSARARPPTPLSSISLPGERMGWGCAPSPRRGPPAKQAAWCCGLHAGREGCGLGGTAAGARRTAAGLGALLLGSEHCCWARRGRRPAEPSSPLRLAHSISGLRASSQKLWCRSWKKTSYANSSCWADLVEYSLKFPPPFSPHAGPGRRPAAPTQLMHKVPTTL